MAKSRYANTRVIGNGYATFAALVRSKGYGNVDLLQGVKTFEYIYKKGDRLDHLAARFFNEDAYWWVIALVNDISYPFASGGLVPGKVLKIPSDPKDVFDRLFR